MNSRGEEYITFMESQKEENIKYNDRYGNDSGWTEEEKKEATEDMLRSRFDCGQINPNQGDCMECGDAIAHGTRCNNCLGK